MRLGVGWVSCEMRPREDSSSNGDVGLLVLLLLLIDDNDAFE